MCLGVPQTHVKMEVCALKEMTPFCATAQSSILVILVNRRSGAFFILAKMEACVEKDLIHPDALAHQSTQAPIVSAGITVTLTLAEIVYHLSE